MAMVKWIENPLKKEILWLKFQNEDYHVDYNQRYVLSTHAVFFRA